MTIALIVCAVIVVLLILNYAMGDKKGKTVSSSQMLSTKEGREWLADQIRQRKPDASSIGAIAVCPVCEGTGREFHGTKRIDGWLTHSTWGKHCAACGGTGIMTDLGYEVVDCPLCSGTGVYERMKCSECNGTKVVRQQKGVKEDAE